MTSGLFSYSSLVHALSGAAGSVTGMTVFFPLDTARTRLQVDDDRRASGPLAAILVIAREEGWQSLYRGLGPVLTSISCANFVYFYAFNGLKRLLRRRGIQSSPWTDLAVGSLAGVVNVLTTSPLFVANTRMKLQGARLRTPTVPQNTRYTGIVDALLTMAREEGITTLWNGAVASLILVSNPAIQFTVYEFLKRKLDATKLNALRVFLISATAKAVATVITYPLQVAQTRLRASRSRSSSSSSSSARWNVLAETLACLKNIVRIQGFRGLYKGIQVKLLQTVLTAALMFVVYEKIAAFIFTILRARTVPS
eukprot:m.15161 g.15161  ORF g.15161 m.15161 type:complete len:311 (+) comp26224_c0_seq2:66-998(+)